MTPPTQLRNSAARPYHSQLCRLVSYCLVAIFSLSLFGQGLNTITAASDAPATVFIGEYPADHQPLDVPVAPDSQPLETQPEKDTENSFGDDWLKLTVASEPVHFFDLRSARTSFLECIRALHNRSAISLVVLHHAWKSSIQ